MGIGYKKSRNGCTQCKKRRVKCDESRPCGACLRHKVTCSLTLSSHEQKSRISDPARDRASNTIQDAGGLISRPLGRPLLPLPLSPGHGPPTPDSHWEDDTRSDDTISRKAWMADLELMHHYTMITCETLAASPRSQRVFREDMPRLAPHYPFLLHQILAISAFHLAYLHPESRSKYTLRGSQHQSEGLTGMREALSENITESSSYALFGASSLLISCAFASGLNDDHVTLRVSPLHAILDIFTIFRGTAALDMFAMEQLRNTPSANFYDPTMPNVRDPFLFPSMRMKLSHLRTKIHDCVQDDDNVKMTLDSGLACLLDCMENTPGPTLFATPQQRILYLWPMVVSGDFLGLLRAHNPVALVIFLHYCAVLQVIEEESWTLSGWSQALARSFSALLQNSSWAAEAEWPMERIEGRHIKS